MSKPQQHHPLVTIQYAQVDDAPRISELGTRVFSASFGHTVTPQQLQAYIDSAYSTAAVTSDIQNPRMDVIMAIDSDKQEVLGFAQLTRGTTEPCLKDYDNVVELQRIYLDPKAHGTGVAKLLHDELEMRARNEQFKWLWLGVWEENFKAQRAYEKWGFRKVGEHAFDVGGDVQTDFVLIKAL